MSGKLKIETFYQGVIQNYEQDNSIVITKVEDKLCKEGYMSVVSRVTVCGHKESTPKRKVYQKILIVKRLPSKEKQQNFRSNIAMKNESISYNTIIPALKRHSTNVPLPFGDCLYADENLIILEDLCVDGFTAVGKSSGGLSIKQCEIAIEGLAKLHAASFVFKHEEPEKFHKISKLTKELLYEGGDSDLLKAEIILISNLISKFSNDMNKYEGAVVVLKDLEKNLTSKIKQLLQHPGEYSVICHGDCWADNIMFNEKNELKLVDFQIMRYNSVASDLCYLLYVNLAPDDRVKHMQKLLNRYLHSLREYIKKNGIDMDSVLTVEWLEKEVQTFTLFGVFYGMWTTPVFFSKDEDVNELPNSSKIGNLENPECAKRIEKIILQYVKSLC